MATALTAGVPLFFVTMTVLDAAGKPRPAWSVFWSIFGASNQLLAGLALIGVTVWLLNTRKGSKVWLVSFLPAVWMFCMSNWALIRMIRDGWFKTGSLVFTSDPVPYVAFILFVLAVLMAVETIFAITKKGAPGTPQAAQA